MIEHPRLRFLIAAVLEGRLTAEEGQELHDILRDDPEAQRSYVQHCMMDAMLSEEVETLRLLDAAAEPSNVVPLPLAGGSAASAGDGTDDVGRSTVFRSRARVGAFGIACSAAGIAAALLFTRWGSSPVAGGPDSFEPPVSEAPILVRETRLSDGSTVQLAPKSSVALRYSEHERALDLEDGEAHFAVAPDATRPFVVNVGAIRVRAVGTAFNVRRAGSRVAVTVTEGQVEMGRAADAETLPGLGSLVVTAGNRVVWNDDAPSSAPVLAAVDPSRALSWREGRLEYTREPLWAIVADVNRYSEYPVEIADAKVEQLLVTTTVLTDSVREWLAGLPGTLPVDVDFQDGRVAIVGDRMALPSQ